MSTFNGNSISSTEHNESVLEQFPVILKNQIHTVISSINTLCPDSTALLILYDEDEFIVPNVMTPKAYSDYCISLFNETLASDFPISNKTIKPQLRLDDELVTQYAGVALKSPENISIGVLSVFSAEACYLESQQEQLLIVLAQSIADKLMLYKKERELEELEEFSSLITDTNQDYIFVKDSNYRLVRANPGFMALHPESVRQYLFSADWSKAYKPDEAKLFLESDATAFKNGRSELEERVTLPNGDSLLLYTTKTRFEDSKGGQYLLGVSRDISEKEQLLADLQKSNQDLDEFAYIASHDLKAPLNAIDRLVSWIEEDAVDQFDEDSKKHFGMIKSRVKRMSNLLSDLLSYSRIGREEHEPVCLNLKECVLNCFELLDIPTGFSFDMDEVDVVLPRVPLELILTNLISNAIKHHDRADGAINVRYSKTECQHQISVCDDGPGISAKMHKKVFERFQTLKPRDQVEGSGLGLAMVQKTAQHLGGGINLKSDIGDGSIFTFFWPV